MTTHKEETVLEKVEKELTEFTKNKSEAEASLKTELAKAKTDYENLVEEIEAKYDIAEVTEDIKRHTYFLRLLKGELSIPDDLNAKKSKVKSSNKAPANFTVPRTYDEAKSDNQKIYFAIAELGSATNTEILKKVNGYGASFDTKQVSNAVNNLKNKFQVIVKDGKEGKALKYKVG